MKAVTIDQITLKDHVRWAEDQHNLDTSFITEPNLVAPHQEATSTSTIYPSKFDVLFELQKRNVPWAAFEPPKNFHLFNKRLFSHRLFAHLEEHTIDEDPEDSAPHQDQEDDNEHPYLKQLANAIQTLHQLQHQTAAVFEKDKSTLTHLVETLTWINNLLTYIHGRKLQYQKG